MSLDSFATIPDLLAGLLAEQRATTEAITRLAATLAGLRTKADGATKTVKRVIQARRRARRSPGRRADFTRP